MIQEKKEKIKSPLALPHNPCYFQRINVYKENKEQMATAQVVQCGAWRGYFTRQK